MSDIAQWLRSDLPFKLQASSLGLAFKGVAAGREILTWRFLFFPATLQKADIRPPMLVQPFLITRYFLFVTFVTSLAFSNSEDLKNGDLRIGQSRNLRLYAVRCSIPNWHLCYLCMDNLSAGGTIRYEMDSESDLHLLGFIPWQQAGQKSVKLTSLTKNAVVDKLLSQVLFWWGKLRLATRWQCSMTCNLWCKHLPEPW